MIKPNKKYTFAELEKLRQQFPDLARTWAKKGYVWRMDLDGTMEMVHYTQASGGGGRFDAPNTLREMEPGRVFGGAPQELTSEDLPRIRKRTPQERMDSLMAKVATDIKAGRVLTLDDVNKNRPDRPPAERLDGEVVREVVQTFMEKAEAVNEEAESKKIVRTAPSD